ISRCADQVPGPCRALAVSPCSLSSRITIFGAAGHTSTDGGAAAHPARCTQSGIRATGVNATKDQTPDKLHSRTALQLRAVAGLLRWHWAPAADRGYPAP